MTICKNCQRDFRLMPMQQGGLCRDCAVEQFRPERQRTLDALGSLPLTFEHVLQQSEVYTTSSQQHLVGDLFFTQSGLIFVHYLTLTIGSDVIQGGLAPYNSGQQSESKFIEAQMKLLHGEDYGSSVEERYIRHGGMVFPRAHIQNISVDTSNQALRITYDGADYWMLVKDAWGEQRFIESWLAGASTVVSDGLGAHLAVPSPARLLYMVETGRFAPDFLPQQLDKVLGDQDYYRELYRLISLQKVNRQEQAMSALSALPLSFTAGWAEHLETIAGRQRRWMIIAGLVFGLALVGSILFVALYRDAQFSSAVVFGICGFSGVVLGLIFLPVSVARFSRVSRWIRKLRGE